jgi:1-acyl-sn-glycerol-3-phosphate acyltransferase
MTARDRAAPFPLKLTRTLCRLTMRVEVEGLDRFPRDGPVVVAFNHLSIADGPLVAALLPRPGVFLIAREFDRIPILNRWIRAVANPIYIERGIPDPRAVVRARAVLEDGGVLCLAPEGRVSRTGALAIAQEGAAFVARSTDALIVPFAAWGQEKFWRQWLRLRRPRVRVVVGEAFALTHERAAENTRVLMARLAELLPPRYQGAYRTTSCGQAP